MDPQSNGAKRNGKIELYRFFFCIAVLLFHAEKYILGEPSFDDGYHLSLFSHGAMGCEFFFIVSGYLMAKSVYKKMTAQAKNQPKEWLGFIKKKYLDIFPQHTIAFVFAFFALVISRQYGFVQTIKYAVDSLPNFFLVQMTGVNYSSPNHFEWYISCMLIALAILYPICRKWYYQFTKYFSWIVAALILGFLIYTGGGLTGVTVWTGICYRSLLRAIAEIALGTAAFELSRNISAKQYSKKQQMFLTVGEVVCFAAVVVLLIVTVPRKYEIYTLAFIFILVVIAFSKISYGSERFDNKLSYFLGKLSLPVYLGQLPAIYIVTNFSDSCSDAVKIVMVVALTFLFAGAILCGGELFNNYIRGKNEKSKTIKQ